MFHGGKDDLPRPSPQMVVFHKGNTPKFNMLLLRNDSWKTILSLGFRPIFRGELLNFRGAGPGEYQVGQIG